MMRTQLLCTLALAALALPAAAAAQQVKFESDLPRAMVFLKEDGATAATVLTGFLSEAGFEVIDPAFAKTAAQQERARQALAGDNAAATALGRDLGAQVIILGTLTAGAAPNPADRSLQTGTARLDVRALRLDQPRTVATGNGSGRAVDATPEGAKTGAIQKAAETLLYKTGFVGSIATDWGERVWDNRAYWQPEPGSVTAVLSGPAEGAGKAAGGMRLAIVESDLYPAPNPDDARGIKAKPAAQASGQAGQHRSREPDRLVRVRGIVSDPRAQVAVGGRAATLRALSDEERRRYGIAAAGLMFEGSVLVPAGQDTVRVQARSGSQSTETLVQPTIGKRWAVVVGVSDYKDSRITPLKYADDDARAMYNFLRSPAGGSVPESQMRLLLNEQATSAALRDALFVFLQQARENDMVTVYIASHGSPDPQRPANLYILPYDTNADALAATAFPMWDFKTAVRRQIAAERVVVIADACHSAGTLVDEANPIGGAFTEMFSPSRRVTLTAAAAEESSLEGKDWGGGHGVFTHALLEALRGKGDTDGDGVVTFSEAARYVETQVPTQTGGQQNPQRAGMGDVPLAALRPGG